MKKTLIFVILALGLCCIFTSCDPSQEAPDLGYSIGLEFISNGDGTCFVNGIGSCTDTHIVVPPISPDGDSVITISKTAFSEFEGVTEITIPDSITGVSTLHNHALGYCPTLEKVNISDTHPDFKSVDGVVYYKNGARLVWYPCGRTESSYTVAEGTYGIASFAFNCCKNLKGIVLPAECVGIESHAFRGCISLESIILPEGTKEIPNGAFISCTSLTSIVIPTSVTGIGDMAFIQCPLLTDIYYGGSQDDWAKINMGCDTGLDNVTIHYNHQGEK